MPQIIKSAKAAGLRLILPQAALDENTVKNVWAAYGGSNAGTNSIITVAGSAAAAFKLVEKYSYILLAPASQSDPLACSRQTGLLTGAIKLAGKKSVTEGVFCRVPSDFSDTAGFPVFETLRFAAWSAVASGATGIFYGPAAPARLSELGDLLACAARVNAELADMAPVVSAARAEQPPLRAPAPLRAAAWRHHGRLYTVLINTGPSAMAAPAELLNGRFRPLFETNRDVRASLALYKGRYYIQGHRVLVLES
ncbi:MAG: hypothetical protein PHW69_03705 [Elusimicrobiaceae bacterium]|nr:hypothetical protein [Elusimicrobiaceae bacterium]